MIALSALGSEPALSDWASKGFVVRECQLRIRANFAFERELWERGLGPNERFQVVPFSLYL